MSQIEHDPKEPRIDRSNTVYWVAWTIVALLWVWAVYFFEIDWRQIALGGLTAGVFIIHVTEATGNKLPPFWWPR